MSPLRFLRPPIRPPRQRDACLAQTRPAQLLEAATDEKFPLAFAALRANSFVVAMTRKRRFR